MSLKWRPDMTPAEEEALLADIEQLDEQYSCVVELPMAEEDECELFDPVRDGWVDRNGRP
jgi:hypothetical protein